MAQVNDKLRAWREAEGHTLRAAAAIFGVTATAYWEWEQGFKHPEIRHVIRIADVTHGTEHEIRVFDWRETEAEREARMDRARTYRLEHRRNGTDDAHGTAADESGNVAACAVESHDT